MKNDKTTARTFNTGAMASALASVCLAALFAPGANAQTAPASAAAATPADPTDIGEILVTARRQSESLQNVPESVQVVTGAAIQKLAITQATEISKLAPGLTLGATGDSTGTKIVLRGIAWQPASGTPATPIYLNEVPFDPFRTIQALFDIGQIEVLRGPQGTSRGAPSISGAVTIATVRPNLEKIGGYVQGQYGEGNHTDLQGALNIPIIKDILALRGAFNIEDSQANRVYSIHSTIQPQSRNRDYRLTALFTPTDTITVQAMFQRADQLTKIFNEVVGTGSPGNPALGIPANFNGRALTYKDMKSVENEPNYQPSNIDFVTVNASWRVLGQKLSYNFGRQIDHSGSEYLNEDPGNSIPGYFYPQSTTNVGTPFFQTQEVRLSSDTQGKHLLDYDIGWFSKHSHAILDVEKPVFYLGGLGGAFGAPGALPGAVTTPNNAYTLNTSTRIGLGQVFDSFYGNLRVHIDSNTELSGGVSFVRDRVPVNLAVTSSGARLVATPLSALAANFGPLAPLVTCQGIPAYGIATGLQPSQYPGYCDAVLPNGVANESQDNNNKYTHALYNFSLSHKFTPDLMAYATTGTSYRSGLPAIGNLGLPANYEAPKPETATSYEVGVKTSLSHRLRIDADVFQINYKNQLTALPNVPYYNSASAQTSLTTAAFYGNVDARVRGVELEMDASITHALSLGANVSYSRITSRGGQLPCAGTAALTAANPLNVCQSAAGQVLNTQAPFQATVNGSYNVPINAQYDGYFRFNVNFQGNNPNFGNYADPGNSAATSSYAIFDVFAGVTQLKNGWDFGFYAKNLFNVEKELNRFALSNQYAPFAATGGYDAVSGTLPREIGVTLRIPFGSH